jgi:Mrp family chromosome partitioning ATPase
MTSYGTVFQSLIYSILQQPRAESDKGIALCFTSAQSGEGVTHVVRALSNELGSQAPERVARVDLAYLQTRALPLSKTTAMVLSPKDDGTMENEGVVSETPGSDLSPNWHGSRKFRQESIDKLRSHFDYVLIDCPSLKVSGDALGIAPLVDGVFLVVEANRTQAHQVLHAERQIHGAGGAIYGHILNKRKYFIPRWIYRWVSAN